MGVSEADTIVEAHIEGSVSSFYLLGTAFDTAANWNDLDIYLLGGMSGDGTENLIPLAQSIPKSKPCLEEWGF